MGQVAPVLLGQTKIGDPHRSVGIQQQVGRLDVPVQHALAVGMGQRLGNLKSHVGPRCGNSAVGSRMIAQSLLPDWLGRMVHRAPADLVGRLPAATSQAGLTGVAGRVARGKRPVNRFAAMTWRLVACNSSSTTSSPVPVNELHRVVVDALILANAEHGDDVRVVQPGRGPSFVLKSRQQLWSQDRSATEAPSGPHAGPATTCSAS